MQRIERFLSSSEAQPIGIQAMRRKAEPELKEFLEVRTQIFHLMKKADELAAIIRQKVQNNDLEESLPERGPVPVVKSSEVTSGRS